MYPVLSLCFFLSTSCYFLLELFHALYATSGCFVIRYAEQFSVAWSMFFKLGFGHPDIFFFARYQHDTYFLLPFRKHLTWLDSAGVQDSTECAGFFFSAERVCCYAVLTSHINGETGVYSDNPSLSRFYRSNVYVLQN